MSDKHTSFNSIYNCFLGKITDDMYLEWTEEDTLKDLQSILLNAIPGFEFPRFRLYNYTIQSLEIKEKNNTLSFDDKSFFEDELSHEEINILAELMVEEWLKRQITSIENIRMKYSGPDFKMTSQANHLAKLLNLKSAIDKEDRHNQRLYKRRKTNPDGTISSNWSVLLESRAVDD